MKKILKEYARLLVEKGINVQKKQDVIIRAGLDQVEFVEEATRLCYKKGARKVTVEWQHQPLEKVQYKYCAEKVLSDIPEWEQKKYDYLADTLPAILYLESEDPNGLAGVDQKKVANVRKNRYPIVRAYRDKIENKYQWCIAGVPGKAWAKKVFPDVSANIAEKKLWEAILYTSRADNSDPVQAWEEHNADLKRRYTYLNSLKIKRLVYRASNGTDISVGLIDGGRFAGGEERTLSGIPFNPNVPSEEVFTSPEAGDAEGIVYASRPLSYRGELIENFWLRFENGRVVEAHAEKNEELLKTMIAMDERSCMLGECALVPYDSPIRNSGITFLNTLYDENACCHFALGEGFPECLEGFENMTLEECRQKGINESIIHVDFMIGTADLSIDAVTDTGVVPVFREGNWAF